MRSANISLAIVGLLLAPCVYAAEDFEFAMHDRNSDGHLDEREWEALGSPADFEEADIDEDGRVSLTEARVLRIREDENWQLRDERQRPVPAVEQQADTELGERVFQEYDANSDGRISRDEIDSNNLPALAAQFDTWDVDDSGALEQQEFDRAIADFSSYDVNEDGEITEDEVVNEEFIITDFEIWDSNSDGLLDEVEFERGLAQINGSDNTDEQRRREQ